MGRFPALDVVAVSPDHDFMSDPYRLPYPSRRYPVYAARGMVATSQHLGAEAGLEILKRGGNAVDAAVATAVALTVVEPCSNGIGGDAFAIVRAEGRLYGLNSSGPAPRAASAERLRREGLGELPPFGWLPVTVPGIPLAWERLSQRFGRLPFPELFIPAIRYAREGYALSPLVAQAWKRAFGLYSRIASGRPEFSSWFETFTPAGRAPRVGEIVRLPDHAKSLEDIAGEGARAFYRGALAERIDAFSRETGGILRGEDLADYEAEWVEPLAQEFAGARIHELPPNGQGLVALIALGILEALAGTAVERSVLDRDGSRAHLEIEAIKLAFSVGKAALADPRFMHESPEALLVPARLAALAARVGETAAEPGPARAERGGTVYLATADESGLMVSYIQSNYRGFGSGLVVPGTGIALQNRGANFSLEAGHPNELAPGKRPYHTIIPGFLSGSEGNEGPFGVMGGFMQPQGHVQVTLKRLREGLNPQAALDAPRWCWVEGQKVLVEQSMPEALLRRLADRGHRLEISLETGEFGRGAVIATTPEGSLVAGCEPRSDSAVAAW